VKGKQTIPHEQVRNIRLTNNGGNSTATQNGKLRIEWVKHFLPTHLTKVSWK